MENAKETLKFKQNIPSVVVSGLCLEMQCIIADTDLEFFASEKEYTRKKKFAWQYLHWNKNEVEKES